MSHQSDLISTDIDAYLAQHENKELLRFLTCGNVDDGYTGSGKRFSNAVNKYGIEQFSRITIEYVIFEDAVLLREQHYLDTRNCAKSKQYYTRRGLCCYTLQM